MSELELQKAFDNPDAAAPGLFRQIQRSNNCSLVNSSAVIRRTGQAAETTARITGFTNRLLSRYAYHSVPGSQEQSLTLVAPVEYVSETNLPYNEFQNAKDNSANNSFSNENISGSIIPKQSVSGHSPSTVSKIPDNRMLRKEHSDAGKNVNHLTLVHTGDTTTQNLQNFSSGITVNGTTQAQDRGENVTQHHDNTTIQIPNNSISPFPQSTSVKNSDLTVRASSKVSSRSIKSGLINTTPIQRSVKNKSDTASRHTIPVQHILLRTRDEQQDILPSATVVSTVSQTIPQAEKQTLTNTSQESRKSSATSSSQHETTLYRKIITDNNPAITKDVPSTTPLKHNDISETTTIVPEFTSTGNSSVKEMSPDSRNTSETRSVHDSGIPSETQLFHESKPVATGTALFTAPVVSPVTGAGNNHGFVKNNHIKIYRSVAQTSLEKHRSDTSGFSTTAQDEAYTHPEYGKSSNSLSLSNDTHSDLQHISEQIVAPKSNHVENTPATLLFRKENLLNGNAMSNIHPFDENRGTVPDPVSSHSNNTDSLADISTTTIDNTIFEKNNPVFRKENTSDKSVLSAPALESTHNDTSVEMVWRKENASNTQPQISTGTTSVNSSFPAVARAIDDTASRNSIPGSNQFPSTIIREAAPNGSSIDIEAIAEQVERTISRRLMIERERRGERL